MATLSVPEVAKLLPFQGRYNATACLKLLKFNRIESRRRLGTDIRRAILRELNNLLRGAILALETQRRELGVHTLEKNIEVFQEKYRRRESILNDCKVAQQSRGVSKLTARVSRMAKSRRRSVREPREGSAQILGPVTASRRSESVQTQSAVHSITNSRDSDRITSAISDTTTTTNANDYSSVVKSFLAKIPGFTTTFKKPEPVDLLERSSSESHIVAIAQLSDAELQKRMEFAQNGLESYSTLLRDNRILLEKARDGEAQLNREGARIVLAHRLLSTAPETLDLILSPHSPLRSQGNDAAHPSEIERDRMVAAIESFIVEDGILEHHQSGLIEIYRLLHGNGNMLDTV